MNDLRARSIGVDVDGRTLFTDLNFTVAPGELLVLIGASGSGKTTLAHTLAGVLEPDRGEVTLGGVPLRALNDAAARPALVTQDFGLIPVLTAAEAISLPLRVRALSKSDVKGRTAQWMSALGLESCATRAVEELSGGQRQRVAIARALAMESDVIVMDEPTAELDPTNRALVVSLLERELARGAGLVIVSHETDVIARAHVVYDLSTRR